ncbi:MAG: serine hydrolase [Caldilineaceae bacterium]|nr:serine hydrolase [Caldilineaceae bacterium]
MSHPFWSQLEARLHDQINRIDAVAGLCVRDLTTGDQIAVNGDHLFPTASTIKLHVLTQLFVQADAGKLDLAETLDGADWRVPGSGIISYLDDARTFTLRDYATMMIVLSDNSATNLIIDKVGIDAVNAMLDELELPRTRLRRKMFDMQAGQEDNENVATPAELVTMLGLLHAGRPTESAARQALTVLQKPKSSFIQRVLFYSDLVIANKPGWTSGIRSDAGIIYLPRRPYALAVMLSYGYARPEQMDTAMTDLIRTVHEHMSCLDASNRFGHAVFG